MELVSRVPLRAARRVGSRGSTQISSFTPTRTLTHRSQLGGNSLSRASGYGRDSGKPQPTSARHGQVRGVKTVQQAKTQFKIGPFSGSAIALFFAAGIGMTFYFRYEKARMERKRIAEANKGVGKPEVGGVFELTDQDGHRWSSTKEMGGKFSLVYFGFSHCPDICPEELDKMAEMIDMVAASLGKSSRSPNAPSLQDAESSRPTSAAASPLLPVFITCDPARDTPAVLKTYLAEFHPALIGLTGAWEEVKAVCKLYRVYFSTPPNVKPGMDYLVDHSIYFYLMDPEGDFVEAIGRQHTAEQGAKLILDHMSDWKDGKRKD